jgi:hypothetical protein
MLQIASISGVDLSKLFIPGESEDFSNRDLSFVQIHQIDQRNKKLIKMKIKQGRGVARPQRVQVREPSDPMAEHEEGAGQEGAVEDHEKFLVVEIEEYLPKELVDDFMPFQCWAKLNDMRKNAVSNMVDYDC